MNVFAWTSDKIEVSSNWNLYFKTFHFSVLVTSVCRQRYLIKVEITFFLFSYCDESHINNWSSIFMICKLKLKFLWIERSLDRWATGQASSMTESTERYYKLHINCNNMT